MISFTKNVTIIAALTFIILASTAGQLTEEEIEHFKRSFSQLDKLQRGFIDIIQFKQYMKTIDRHMTEFTMELLFINFDTNKNNQIDLQEFINMASQINNSEDDENTMLEAFKAYDRDGNGFINAEELRYTLSVLGEIVSDELANEMIKEFDTNGDNLIDYEEFKILMKSKPREVSINIHDNNS